MQKIYSYIVILLTMQLIISCNERFGEVMEMAGENRSELIKVLEHYKEDSLKSAAAMFLVENMYHYCHKDSGILYDAQHITADYLIRDIDLAFECWKQSAWKDDVDFETFCHFILPYRVSNEPLSCWRDSLRNEYSHLITGIDSPIEAFAKVHSIIIRQFNKLGSTKHLSLDAMTLHHLHQGTCDQRSIYIVSVMRALGIPAAYDYVPFWGNYSSNGHSWAAYVNHNKTHTVYGDDSVAKEFNRIDGESFNDNGILIHPHQQWDSIKRAPVIQRICYEKQQSSSTYYDKDIPQELKAPFSANVSRQYGYNLSITLPNRHEGKAYLSAFKTGWGWQAVIESEVKANETTFRDLPGRMVYLPLNCHNGERNSIGNPFILDGNGRSHTFKPDYQKLQAITIWRKYPLRKQWYNRWKMMLGSTVEVADDTTFRHKKVVYTFNTPPESILEIPLKLDRPYRCIRIQTTTAERPEIAELKVFTSKRKKVLKGEIIYYNVPDSTVRNIFDNNYLTYAQKAIHGYWVGLDLGKENRDTIGCIEFCPRHDMNMIRKGHEYELFYFDMEWKSLGRQIARTDSLTFDNVPSNALLWLRDYTDGTEERPFTFEDGKQVWW